MKGKGKILFIGRKELLLLSYHDLLTSRTFSKLSGVILKWKGTFACVFDVCTTTDRQPLRNKTSRTNALVLEHVTGVKSVSELDTHSHLPELQ